MTKRLDPAEKELRANVRRGARLLDRTVPGWPEKLHNAMQAGKFEMVEPTRCVVGTLELAKWRPFQHYDGPEFGYDYSRFEIRLNGVYLCDWMETEQYGFYTTQIIPNEDIYDKLEELWTEEVEKRLGK